MARHLVHDFNVTVSDSTSPHPKQTRSGSSGSLSPSVSLRAKIGLPVVSFQGISCHSCSRRAGSRGRARKVWIDLELFGGSSPAADSALHDSCHRFGWWMFRVTVSGRVGRGIGGDSPRLRGKSLGVQVQCSQRGTTGSCRSTVLPGPKAGLVPPLRRR